MINLDPRELKTEATGERIVCQLQEYLLLKVDADECAVLPEDKIQRLLVGVSRISMFRSSGFISSFFLNILHYFISTSFQACNQLEIATHIEITTSMLCRDAVGIMKAALAGTKTTRFTDVMEAAFVEDGATVAQGDPDTQLEEEEEEGYIEESPELQQSEPSTSTLTRAMKHKLPVPTEGIKKKPSAHPGKGGVCDLKFATPYFPSVSDKEKYLHAGVDAKYISDRISSTRPNIAGYGCLFSTVSKKEGKIVEDCNVISMTKAQLSTHLRQYHLGLAIFCFVCNRKWWAVATWLKHMQKDHSSLKYDDYFLREGAKEELQGRTIVVKEEVSNIAV